MMSARSWGACMAALLVTSALAVSHSCSRPVSQLLHKLLHVRARIVVGHHDASTATCSRQQCRPLRSAAVDNE